MKAKNEKQKSPVEQFRRAQKALREQNIIVNDWFFVNGGQGRVNASELEELEFGQRIYAIENFTDPHRFRAVGFEAKEKGGPVLTITGMIELTILD